MVRILWLILFTACVLTAAAQAEVKIQPDVVYGHKDGMALTFDVFTPEQPNGAGVLWLQSGGWYSGWREPEQMAAASRGFLDAGYTVFIVRHGSAPRFQVPDAIADVQRCVRFIRLHASDYGVFEDRLGVTGGSAGGHLTLMLATTGDDGNPEAKDRVLQHSSRIRCGVALYPPTDLRGWTTDPPEEIKKHAGLKPPLSFAAELEASVSPVVHVTSDDAPVMLIHGDKDVLVPIEHSRNIDPLLTEAKVPHELIIVAGAGHGYSPEQNRDIVQPAMMRWFETHLLTPAKPEKRR
ncbi:MAG: alpha/beta hydrolase [Planctomycetaceae bacterium]|nr:alpha/beta hydrolase [Planctomycetaceae bacterium]